MKLKMNNLPEWNMVAGESKIRTITLRNEETGNPYNLEGATAVFTVVDFVNFEADALVSNREVPIAADNNGVFCLCTLTLNPEDTEGEYGKYIYQISITDAFGHCSKPRGVLYITGSKDD